MSPCVARTELWSVRLGTRSIYTAAQMRPTTCLSGQPFAHSAEHSTGTGFRWPSSEENRRDDSGERQRLVCLGSDERRECGPRTCKRGRSRAHRRIFLALRDSEREDEGQAKKRPRGPPSGPELARTRRLRGVRDPRGGHMADEAARPGGTVTTPLPPGPAGPPAVETSPTESSPSVYQGLMRPVGGPVSAAWREGTLTRAKELEFLCEWVVATHPKPHSEILVEGVRCHLEAARQAARLEELNPKKGLHLFRYGSLRERAMSNLDAAEAHLLNIASPEYVLGQLPSLLQHVRCHLVVTDPRRQELERIARRLGVADPDRPVVSNANEPAYTERRRIVDEERGQIVTAMRAACSASLREQVRVRSFRNVLVATALVMALLAIGVAIVGLFYPTLIPMCFAPEASGRAVVVCPTKQSVPFSTTTPAGSPTPTPTPTPPSSTTRDIDDAIVEAAT